MAFSQWKSSVLGKHIDEDGAYGDQCVDVFINYVKYLYPGKPWSAITGIGNANTLFARSSSTYFAKILNDHSNPNQLPRTGDVAVFAGTPTNSAGHIAVVDGANADGMNLIQQDGLIDLDAQGNAHGVCYESFRRWNQSPCIGWLRPKTSAPPAPVYHVVVKGDTMTSIAKANGLSLAQLEKLNPAISNPNVIYVNEKIRVK